MAAVTVAGAGPAGLMAADVLSKAGHQVTLLDHKAAPARKFLLAGRGGLNLTHSESLDQFLDHYGVARPFLEPMIRAFPPEALRDWAEALGQQTFVGSSGRVFPKAMKASPLVRAVLLRLQSRGVVLKRATPWLGFDSKPTILALGGASWPETGSDANWVPAFSAAGIAVHSFSASNGRLSIKWSDQFREKHSGTPLKNIMLRHGQNVAKGEVMISETGLEGGAVYQLSASLRAAPDKPLVIDLKPALAGDAIARRLSRPRGSMSQSNFLRKALGLSPLAIALLHETQTRIDHEGVKNVTLATAGMLDLRRSISSAGGVDLGELDAACQLRKVPGVYCVGEMLDWDAPTGGYLLQACFSTAYVAARDLATKLA